jgi:hypothetical protein
MSGNLQALHGYWLPGRADRTAVPGFARAKEFLGSAAAFLAEMVSAADDRAAFASVDGEFERLPGYLQRDVGVTPDMLHGRRLQMRESDPIESPRAVRARLVAALPGLHQ